MSIGNELTMMEAAGMIGQVWLVSFEEIEVPCQLAGVKQSYGNWRFEVVPVGGLGSQWVDWKRLKGEANGKQTD